MAGSPTNKQMKPKEKLQTKLILLYVFESQMFVLQVRFVDLNTKLRKRDKSAKKVNCLSFVYCLFSSQFAATGSIFSSF